MFKREEDVIGIKNILQAATSARNITRNDSSIFKS